MVKAKDMDRGRAREDWGSSEKKKGYRRLSILQYCASAHVEAACHVILYSVRKKCSAVPEKNGLSQWSLGLSTAP